MNWQFKTSWKTQLNILWGGQVVLLAMLAMSMPYWPLYIAQLGHYSAHEIRFWSAAIYVAPFITSTFCSPLWGKLGDRYGYKPMVLRASLGLLITQTLILLFSNVFLILLFRLLQGLLAGFIVAAQALALAISPNDQRGGTIGKLQSATAIGNLVGPLMGGVIATYAGYHAIFSSSSILCAVVTLIFFLFLQDNIKKRAHDDMSQATQNISPHTKDRGKIKFLSKLQKHVVIILMTILFIQLARQIITPVFALFVTEKLGGNDIMVGLLYAANGLTILITAPYWGKLFDRAIQADYPIYPCVALLLLVSAVLQFLHAYADTAMEILILRLLWGICLGALLPVLLRLLLDQTSNTENGFFLGFSNSATKMGNLLGILLGAVVASYFGYTNSFLLTAGLYLFSALVISVCLKPEKHKENALKHSDSVA